MLYLSLKATIIKVYRHDFYKNIIVLKIKMSFNVIVHSKEVQDPEKFIEDPLSSVVISFFLWATKTKPSEIGLAHQSL